MKFLLTMSIIAIIFMTIINDASAKNLKTKRPVSAHKQQPWVTAYYPGWRESVMPIDELDLGSITHLVYFSLLPTSIGGVDGAKSGVSDATALAIAAKIHKAGKKALICIGGADSAMAIRPQIRPNNRTKLITNIVTWIDSHHYDGVDIDMEPLEDSDLMDYQGFMIELHSTLKAKNSNYLLTVAVGNNPKCCLRIANIIDQINVMTYDMSGTWEGWVTWHNGPIDNKTVHFPGDGPLLPSVDATIKNWISAGVDPAKLGLGIAFYGVVWHGATGPNQPIAGVTTEQIPYSQIMQLYYTNDRYRWDANASASYLSQDDPDKTKRFFVSYDDERLCKAKLDYARSHKLGGVIIWELGSAYMPGQPKGKRQPLLDALK